MRGKDIGVGLARRGVKKMNAITNSPDDQVLAEHAAAIRVLEAA